MALVFGGAVFAVFTLIFLILGARWAAPVVGLIAAVAWVLIAWRRGESVVLDLCDVDDADPDDHARLFNVVGGLCAAMGLPAPSLYVIDDPALNALAVGRNANNASIAVTQGLLNESTVVELEAIVALQMYRIKAGDIAPETFAVLTFGAPAVLSELCDEWDVLRRFFALPLPLIEQALTKLHPSRHELDTDLAAVEFTRYPPALAAGLTRMEGRSAVGVATPVTAHLWAAPSMALSANTAIAHINAPLNQRIAVLNEL